MARPKKCRICGYRFKGNEDICPECFTAREDDISCEQFSNDEHTHSSGFSTTEPSDVFEEFHEKSFVEEQRVEEANDPIPSATFGGKMGTPDPTYAQQSYTARNESTPNYNYGSSTGSSRQDKLNALRNGASYTNNRTTYQSSGSNNTNSTNPWVAAFNARQNAQNQTYYSREATKPKGKGGCIIGIVVFFFITTFLLPLIIGITVAVSGSSDKDDDSVKTKTTRPDLNISVEMPDISLPDILREDFDALMASYDTEDYSVNLKHITRFLPFDREYNQGLFTVEEYATVEPHMEEDDTFYRIIQMDISTEGKEKEYEFDENDIFLESLDSNGNIICTSKVLLGGAIASKSKGVMFVVPFSSYSYILSIPVKEIGSDNEEPVMVEIRSWNCSNVEDDYGYNVLNDALELPANLADSHEDSE